MLESVKVQRVPVIIVMFIMMAINPLANPLLAEEIPLVYDVEHTGARFPVPVLPTFEQLPTIDLLTDPFEWSDGNGRDTQFKSWSRRRAEIKAEIEHYEIGLKPPRPQDITATYANGKLTVKVTVDGNTLTLNSNVSLPSGNGPFPALISIGMWGRSGSLPYDIFQSRDIATISFNFAEVMAHQQNRGNEPINKLYPELTAMGAYSAWPWGVSRLIDGLELVQEDLPIDLKHLGITGCSFAGKMALFAGALDERIALTISQEPGGGGAAAWRVSETLGKVEKLGATSHAWFMESMFQFSGTNVAKLPMDHHELIAMVAPRACLVLGNPSQRWLADESGYVSCRAAHEVWKTFGIGDRFGYSFIGGHGHCQLPDSQRPEVEAFVDKFLLGDMAVNTEDITIAPMFKDVDAKRWYKWWGDKTAPAVPTGLTATAQSYKQIDLDWDDNGEVDLKHYQVLRSQDAGQTYSKIAIVTKSAYRDVNPEDRLSPSTTYFYAIAAVDHAQNESRTSHQSRATTENLPDDNDPPTPNPATWDSAPKAIGPMTITMTATAGRDLCVPLQYYFDETSGNPGGVDSGWQVANSYTNTSLLPATAYTYRVRMRDDLGNVGGYSASESVTTFERPAPFQEDGGVVAMEAEHGLIGTRWITGNNTTVSNGQYIEIDPAYDNPSGDPAGTTADCVASYDFTISTAGHYAFWFRMVSDDAADDSFFWRIDKGSWILENNRAGMGSWFSTENSQVTNLTTGRHTLQIAYRENGTRLDKFVIQLGRLKTPRGQGPAESDQIK